MSVLNLLLLAIVHTILHEIGHVLTVYAVGAKIKKVGIDMRGPHIVRTAAPSPLSDALVSLAGPAMNFATGIVLLACHNTHAMLPVYIGLFNLLPFPHSDGVHAWNAIKGEVHWQGQE